MPPGVYRAAGLAGGASSSGAQAVPGSGAAGGAGASSSGAQAAPQSRAAHGAKLKWPLVRMWNIKVNDKWQTHVGEFDGDPDMDASDDEFHYERTCMS